MYCVTVQLCVVCVIAEERNYWRVKSNIHTHTMYKMYLFYSFCFKTMPERYNATDKQRQKANVKPIQANCIMGKA